MEPEIRTETWPDNIEPHPSFIGPHPHPSFIEPHPSFIGPHPHPSFIEPHINFLHHIQQVPQPSFKRSRPSFRRLQPSYKKLKSSDKLQQNEKIQPSDLEIQSSDPKPQPRNPEPQPNDLEIQSSDPEPQPSDPEPQPCDPEPQPCDPEPQPSDPEPQPSDPEPQPSDPEPQPSDPEPQPRDLEELQSSGPGPQSSEDPEEIHPRNLDVQPSIARPIQRSRLRQHEPRPTIIEPSYFESITPKLKRFVDLNRFFGVSLLQNRNLAKNVPDSETVLWNSDLSDLIIKPKYIDRVYFLDIFEKNYVLIGRCMKNETSENPLYFECKIHFNVINGYTGELYASVNPTIFFNTISSYNNPIQIMESLKRDGISVTIMLQSYNNMTIDLFQSVLYERYRYEDNQDHIRFKREFEDVDISAIVTDHVMRFNRESSLSMYPVVRSLGIFRNIFNKRNMSVVWCVFGNEYMKKNWTLLVKSVEHHTELFRTSYDGVKIDYYIFYTGIEDMRILETISRVENIRIVRLETVYRGKIVPNENEDMANFYSIVKDKLQIEILKHTSCVTFLNINVQFTFNLSTIALIGKWSDKENVNIYLDTYETNDMMEHDRLKVLISFNPHLIFNIVAHKRPYTTQKWKDKLLSSNNNLELVNLKEYYTVFK